MIVHDLRTPLTAVVGYLDLLKTFEMENFTGEGKELVELARSAAETLIEMISSVLDVSRMESMDLKLNVTECELVDIAKRGGGTIRSPHQGIENSL